jgi:Spy/CpxP family protein refolding chaperone
MKINQLIAIFTLITAPAFAIDFNGIVTPETLVQHRAALSLTVEQETTLTGIYEGAKTEAALLEEAVRTEEAKLGELLRGADLTDAAAAAQLQLLLEAESKLKHLQLKTLVALRSSLTPEQLAKAITLAGQTATETAPLKAGIEAKAARLKSAFDALGIPASPSLKSRGDEVMALINAGDLAAANESLDRLIIDSGLEESGAGAVIDFSGQAPGDTDLEILKQRYEAVEVAASEVISLPLLRQLIQGRDALEVAKENEDAEAVGRILTWAEGILGL